MCRNTRHAALNLSRNMQRDSNEFQFLFSHYKSMTTVSRHSNHSSNPIVKKQKQKQTNKKKNTIIRPLACRCYI